jgi:hypothetical protein
MSTSLFIGFAPKAPSAIITKEQTMASRAIHPGEHLAADRLCVSFAGWLKRPVIPPGSAVPATRWSVARVSIEHDSSVPS